MAKLPLLARLLPLVILVASVIGCSSGETPDPNAKTPGAATAGAAPAPDAGGAKKGGVQPPGV